MAAPIDASMKIVFLQASEYIASPNPKMNNCASVLPNAVTIFEPNDDNISFSTNVTVTLKKSTRTAI